MHERPVPEHLIEGRERLRATRAGGVSDDHLRPAGPLEMQALAGNRATVAWVQRLSVQRDQDLEWGTDELDGGTEAEELQGRPAPRTREQARALVDGHVSPRNCFIELESSRAGYRPISGTGCAHWVAHQRGGPTGTAHVCELGFKYRVTELLATLTRQSSDLQAATVGAVWSANGSSHVGIVRAVTRDDAGTRVVSVSVENDSSASGGVVTQTKTDGSIYA